MHFKSRSFIGDLSDTMLVFWMSCGVPQARRQNISKGKGGGDADYPLFTEWIVISLDPLDVPHAFLHIFIPHEVPPSCSYTPHEAPITPLLRHVR